MRVIDGMMNVNFGERVQPDYMVRVQQDYFKVDDEIYVSPELNQLIDDMDAHGVTKAILEVAVDGPLDSRPLRYVEARPDRFALAVGGMNLLKPMPMLRRLDEFVRNNPVAYVHVAPSFWGDAMYPPTDGVYFPLYVKCCELDLPLCVNTGIPGPPLPAEPQNPIYLDRVLHRFPELKLCMVHGAEPWWEIAIRLMIKYENTRLMTSAWSPKYLPESLLHFMRTRGKSRIMFATDYPMLTFERTLEEAVALDLPEDVLDRWLYANANDYFFGES